MLALFTKRRVYFVLLGSASACLLLMHMALTAHSSTIVEENRTRVDTPIIYNRQSVGSTPLEIQSQRSGQLWESSTPLAIPSQESSLPAVEPMQLEIPSQKSDLPAVEPIRQATLPQRRSLSVVTPTQPATLPPRSSQPAVKRTPLAKAATTPQRNSQPSVKQTRLTKTATLPQRNSQPPIGSPKLATSTQGHGRLPDRPRPPATPSQGSTRQNNPNFHGITRSAKRPSQVGQKEGKSGTQISSQRKRRSIQYQANNRVNRFDPPMRISRVKYTGPLTNRREVTMSDYSNIIEIQINRWLTTS